MSEHKIKPHIFKMGKWFCKSESMPRLGVGNTPINAFQEWKSLNKEFYSNYYNLCFRTKNIEKALGLNDNSQVIRNK